VQIFVKTLTGKSVTLTVGDKIKIGPLKQDGTFLIKTPAGGGVVAGEAEAVSAYAEAYPGAPLVAISPL
jgi:hypothetical protein